MLLADRARFPRDKPCGGGLTGRALKQAPCDVHPVVEHAVDTFELRLRFGRSFRRSSETPLILMTQRRHLDAYLAEQAAAAGAEFRDGVRVDAIELEGTGIQATVGGGSSPRRRARRSRRRQRRRRPGRRPRPGIVRGVALEGNVSWDALDRKRYAGTAVVELGQPDGGYGWVFPKGDHANLGVGGWEEEGPRLRDHLARLAQAHGVSVDALTDVRGHRLPMRRLGVADARERPRAARRRRGRARRSALGRRHLRGVHVGTPRGRCDSRRTTSRALRRPPSPQPSITTPAPPGRQSGRSIDIRLVLLLGCALAGRVRCRLGAARRRCSPSGRGARAGAAAAPPDRAARALGTPRYPAGVKVARIAVPMNAGMMDLITMLKTRRRAAVPATFTSSSASRRSSGSTATSSSCRTHPRSPSRPRGSSRRRHADLAQAARRRSRRPETSTSRSRTRRCRASGSTAFASAERPRSRSA